MQSRRCLNPKSKKIDLCDVRRRGLCSALGKYRQHVRDELGMVSQDSNDFVVRHMKHSFFVVFAGLILQLIKKKIKRKEEIP